MVTAEEFYSIFSVGVNDTVGDFLNDIRNRKLVVWGTGLYGDVLCGLFESEHIGIFCFCNNDSDSWNTKYQGKTIYSWEYIQNNFMEFSVIIASTHYKEIKQQMVDSGYTGEIILLNKNAYSICTLYGKKYVREHSSDYKEVYNLLEDDISKRVFINYLQFNVSLDSVHLRQIDDFEINGYFGTELYCGNSNEIFVDIGAYTGDSIQEFLVNQGYGYDHIYAFEPDSENYALLKSKTEQNNKVSTYNVGIGKQSGVVYFTSKGSAGSSITNQECGHKIIITSLDEIIPEIPVTFIKMDIEGAEAEALHGAENLIHKYHPMLTISAYHKKQDRYELVKLIKTIYPKYHIFFRHTYYYSHNLVQPDVIIYAIDSLENKKC